MISAPVVLGLLKNIVKNMCTLVRAVIIGLRCLNAYLLQLKLAYNRYFSASMLITIMSLNPLF